MDFKIFVVIGKFFSNFEFLTISVIAIEFDLLKYQFINLNVSFNSQRYSFKRFSIKFSQFKCFIRKIKRKFI